MPTYELPFFACGIKPTWWKLPLITSFSWGLALLITFCAACQSAYPLLYLAPLLMMAFFLAACAFSVWKTATCWQALYGVSLYRMRTHDVVSVIAPLLYAISWAIAFLITLCTFINVEWPVQMAAILGRYFSV